jgi:hypothetical protein
MKFEVNIFGETLNNERVAFQMDVTAKHELEAVAKAATRYTVIVPNAFITDARALRVDQ